MEGGERGRCGVGEVERGPRKPGVAVHQHRAFSGIAQDRPQQVAHDAEPELALQRAGSGDEHAQPALGGRGTGALEHAVGSGKAAVAFSLAPVSVKDLMAISDAGEIMPPKSTWFEPKLRDGLLIHEF